MDRHVALILESDRATASAASAAFASRGLEVVTILDFPRALEELRARPAAALVADASILAPDVPAAIQRAARARPETALVLVHEAGGSGAGWFGASSTVAEVVERPGDPAVWARAAARAESISRLLSDLESLRREAAGREGWMRIVGRSGSMERLRERVTRIAAADFPVLVEGEAGAGKEIVARTVHALSRRAHGAFVIADTRLNRPPELGEELFRKGSGLLELAAGGTLYVDEIGDLAPEVQARLVREIASGVVHARVIGATGRDLRRAAAEGRFSDDLLLLFRSGSVRVPPLRERLEDVPLLARRFAEALRQVNDLPGLAIDPDAAAALSRHTWPGNVEELRRVVEQAALLAEDGRIRLPHLPVPIRRLGTADDAEVSAEVEFREAKRRVVEAFERAYLAALMRAHHGNVTAAAAHSGMLRSALQRLLRKYELKSAVFRSASRARSQESEASS